VVVETQVAAERYIAVSKVRAMIRAEITKNNEAIQRAVGEAIGEVARECERRCTAKLEAAMKELAFKGAWQEGKRYRQRNLVSMGGAIYYCSAESTESRPGVGSDWLVFSPKPRDGKDGRDAAVPPEPLERRAVRSQR
jgi:hypothetical protein